MDRHDEADRRMIKPLEGIRVVDLSCALAAPYCTALLADMGAEIIKVESQNGGDIARQWSPFQNDHSLQPRPPSLEEISIKHRIDELYTDYPFYGSRRMAAQLQREGMEVNRNSVQRHMREMGIQALFPEPNLSRRDLKERVYPYLRARFEH